jgi:hypothetical protein
MEEKSLTDCMFFLSSACKNGDRCEFRHSGDALKNFTPCSFWMRGSCTNEFCRFRHPARSNPVKPAYGAPAVPKVDPSSTSCFFYSNGGCTKGKACPFIHDASTLLRGFNPVDGTPCMLTRFIDSVIITYEKTDPLFFFFFFFLSQ